MATPTPTPQDPNNLRRLYSANMNTRPPSDPDPDEVDLDPSASWGREDPLKDALGRLGAAGLVPADDEDDIPPMEPTRGIRPPLPALRTPPGIPKPEPRAATPLPATPLPPPPQARSATPLPRPIAPPSVPPSVPPSGPPMVAPPPSAPAPSTPIWGNLADLERTSSPFGAQPPAFDTSAAGFDPLAGFGLTDSSANNFAGSADLHEQLRTMQEALEELRPVLNDALEKEQEFLKQLAERDERIAELEASLTEAEQHLAEGAPPPPPPRPYTSEEVRQMADEVDQERCRLEQMRKRFDEDRRALREDEEALMKQTREVELQMARERAEMARQSRELQRLHEDIRRELERMQTGDAALKEKMAGFQRRHGEALRAPTAPGATPPAAGGSGSAPPPAGAPPATPTPRSAKDSGLMRRLFGG